MVEQKDHEHVNSMEPKLASRWSRFWATFIDNLVFSGLAIGSYYVFPSLQIVFQSVTTQIIALIYYFSIYVLCQSYFIHKYGKTIGKNVFEIAVVNVSDGQKARFSPFVFKRMLLMGIVYFIPIVNIVVIIANVLFIFRKDRRCIHDLIAGTRVIDISKPPKPLFNE